MSSTTTITPNKKNTCMIPIGDGKLIQLHVPLSIGTLQWGTTPVDNRIINSKGCITETTTRQIMHELCLGKVSRLRA